MSTCFISHATRDAAFAQFVTQRLRSAGVQTFLAPMGIEPGARWSDAIRKELDSSSVVFFLASKEACKSPSVLMEIGGAWLRGKTIIPITMGHGAIGVAELDFRNSGNRPSRQGGDRHPAYSRSFCKATRTTAVDQ